MMDYTVIKSTTDHPGPGLRTVEPACEVEMSTHPSREEAEKALARYVRDHRGYATFRVVAR